jgi:MFS family permease
VLPLVGGALVWVPAALILALSGELMRGIVLAVFCGLVVGSVDNVLRPRLVGRDTQMHDLMILFSTLGGIMVFGPIGFIVGPIIAALFQTVWALFAVAYHDVLPPPAPTLVPEEPEEPEGAAATVEHLVAPVVRPAPLPAETLEPPRSIVGS